MINEIIKKNLNQTFNSPMQLINTERISENLRYHLINKIPLSENIFDLYTDEYLELIREVRKLYYNHSIFLNESDRKLVETDLGKFIISESGQKIWLDVPYEDNSYLFEAEYQGRKVQLGKIMQGDIKKFKVYVKNDKGKVVKVNFGFGGKSAKGKRMVIKKNNPERRKSFRARHNCDNPGPRWKPRYWACKTW